VVSHKVDGWSMTADNRREVNRREVEGYFLDEKRMGSVDPQWGARGICVWELEEEEEFEGVKVPMTYRLSNGDRFRRVTHRYTPPDIGGNWRDSEGNEWSMTQNGNQATLTRSGRVVDIFFSFKAGHWYLFSRENGRLFFPLFFFNFFVDFCFVECCLWTEDEDGYTLSTGDRFSRIVPLVKG